MHRKFLVSTLTAIMVAAGSIPSWAQPPASEPVPTAASSAFRWYVSDIDNSYQPYGVYIPKSYDADKKSGTVIAGLHGFGGSTTSSFSSYLRSWADTNNTILLSLQGRGNQNWDYVADEDMVDVLADLGQNYRLDTNRLFVEGCSMGGHGAYRWALRYPDKFAASAPQSGWTSYEDFYFKWYAGLTEDVGHWGFFNGNQPPSLSSAQYADPSRRPLLENASARYQLPNAKYTSIMMNTSSSDTVNYPQNAQWIRDGLQKSGYPVVDYPWTGDPPQFAWRQVPGGHCASNTPTAVYPFFVGKTRVTDPVSPTYTTNTLKYNGAYWVQMDRLEYANQRATINPTVASRSRIEVNTTNVTQYTLTLDEKLIDMGRPLSVSTNGVLSYSGPAVPSLTLYGSRSADGPLSWSVNPGSAGTMRKSHTSDGPISDAFRSPFVVVYGTSGTPTETTRNRADAQQFVDEWNAVMIQDNPAWGFPGPQRYLSAIADTEVNAETIAAKNLRLFGDQHSNRIVARIAGRLPVRLLDNGIRVGEHTYQGPDVRYTLIYPNPLNPGKYVVLGKGYLTDGTIAGTTLGKNLEDLPWGEPDYVVWNAGVEPGPTVQNPDGTVLRHLPDTYLQAGFFDQNWTLDVTAPRTTLSTRVAGNGTEATLSAADNLGGFGISTTQYRLDGGGWITYAAPFVVPVGVHRIEYRSIDAAGRDASPAGVVPGNTETTRSAVVGAGTLGCDQMITGVHRGPLTVSSSACILDGAVNGPVSVRSGGSLAVLGGVIRGPVTSVGATALLLCHATISGPVSVIRSTGPVSIGGLGGPTCGRTTIRGPVSLVGNTGGVSMVGNTVNGPFTAFVNSGPVMTISANAIGGPLSCAGNSPTPSDAGTRNSVRGPATGQCRTLG